MSAAFDAQSTHPLSSVEPYLLELMGDLRAVSTAVGFQASVAE